MTKKEDDEMLLAGMGAGAALLLAALTMKKPQPEANVAQSKPCGCNKH